METVTVVLAPPANVPEVALRLTQLAVFPAVHWIVFAPVFCRVYWIDVGEKGPPLTPLAVSSPADVTARLSGKVPWTTTSSMFQPLAPPLKSVKVWPRPQRT